MTENLIDRLYKLSKELKSRLPENGLEYLCKCILILVYWCSGIHFQRNHILLEVNQYTNRWVYLFFHYLNNFINPLNNYWFNYLLWGLFLYILYRFCAHFISSFSAYTAPLIMMLLPFHFEWIYDNHYQPEIIGTCLGIFGTLCLSKLLVKGPWHILYLPCFILSLLYISIISPSPFLYYLLYIAIYKKHMPTDVKVHILAFFLACTVLLFLFLNPYIILPSALQGKALTKIGTFIINDWKNLVGWKFIKFEIINYKWRYLGKSVLFGAAITVLWKKRPHWGYITGMFFLATAAGILFSEHSYITIGNIDYYQSNSFQLILGITLGIILLIQNIVEKHIHHKLYLASAFILIYMITFATLNERVFSTPLNYLTYINSAIRFKNSTLNKRIIQELERPSSMSPSIIRELQKKSPSDYYTYLIQHYIRIDQKAKLIKLAQKLLDSPEQENLSIKIKLCSYLIAIGELDLAQELIAVISFDQPENRDYLYLQGELLFKNGEYSKLVDFLEEWETSFREEDVYYFNGLLYFMQGDYALVKESFNSTSGLIRNYPQAAAILGKILYEEDRYARALTYFQMAKNDHFLNADMSVTYLHCLLQTHQFQEGLNLLDHMLNQYDQDTQIRLNAAQIYLEYAERYWYFFPEGNYQDQFIAKTLEQIEYLRKTHKDSAFLCYLETQSHLLKKAYEKAIASQKKAIQYQPYNRKYQAALLRIYLLAEQKDKALKLRKELFQKHGITDADLKKYLPDYELLRSEQNLPVI